MTDYSDAQIEALIDSATPGPWQTSVHAMPGATVDEWFVREIVYNPDPRFHRLNVLKVRGASHAARECCWPPSDADAAFIAAARELVPQLLDRAKIAEAEVERLRAKQTDPVHSEAVRRKVEDLCHEIGRLRQELLQTEGDLAVAVHEAKRWRQTAEAVGRELQGLVSRYTVADENALRVVNLLHQDAYRIGAKLLEQIRALDGAE